MNLILAFIQLIFIIIILLYEYKNGSSVIFLWATLLIIFGLPHFMSVITGLLIFPEYVYIKASFFVILFNLIYLFTRFIFIRIFNAENTFESLKFDLENKTILFKEKKEPGRLLFLLCFFFLISIVFFTKEYGSLLHTSWGQLYGNSMSAYSLGFNLESIRYFTKYILFATGGLFLLYFYQKQMLKSMIVAGIIIMLSIITRDRITILPIIIPFILIFLMKNPKINFKKVLQLTIVGFIVIYIIYALRLFRHYGEITNFINTFDFFEFNNKLFNMLLNDDGELGLRNVFLNFIDNNNDFMNFNQGHTYIRLLLIAIPTSFSFGFFIKKINIKGIIIGRIVILSLVIIDNIIIIPATIILFNICFW